MWESVCLTLMATAGNNIGKVLQKKGTVILPPLSFKLKVIRSYSVNKSWIIGFLMDISGAVLMLRALSLAPVSIIQPISGCGLAILCVFSHFYLKEVMNVLDWVGIALAGAGTIGVGVGGEEQSVSAVSLFHLPWLALSVAILFALLNAWLHIYKRQRQEQELMHSEVVEEIIFGLESGILFGMASVISKVGFVFSEQGFSKIMVPVCIGISICCSATGFVYQARGLKHGRAIVVSTCAAVASIVTGVLAGMLVWVNICLQLLQVGWPSCWDGIQGIIPIWFFIILGVIILVSSARLLALLPRPLRRFLRSNIDKNHNIRRTGSTRVKDTSPSTVIHASTLHHLITTPAKAKA